MAMRVARFPGQVGIGLLGLTWPGVASAAEHDPAGSATIPLIALIFGLIVTVFACITFRRRAMAAEESVKRLEAEKSFTSAVAALGEEQAIIWPFTDDEETVSAGLADMLGIPADTSDCLEALGSILSGTDSDALIKAVDGLRHQRREFNLTVRTQDGGRIFALRGDCVVAGAMGAAVLLIGERTADIIQIDRLESESQALHRVLDTLPVPVWVRDNTLGLKYANQSYRDAVEADDLTSNEDLPELTASGRPSGSGQTLARRALTEKAAQSEQRHIVVNGARRWVEIVEAPFGESDDLAGFAIDITNVEEIQTELSRHIAGHEVILQNLGTAIALYGPDQSLQFFNNAFLQLWDLDEAWLRTSPRMGEVLEELRESRRLPEHANFPSFKQEQLALFTTLIDPLEETLHLPDDKTLRWVAIPHPFGGLLMLWEDVTDAVALERNYYTLIAVQRETLDNLYEGVAVIGANGRLKLSNPAFGSMWEIPVQELDNEPHISEIVDRMAELLHPVDDWMEEKERIIGTLTGREPNTGRIERSDNSVLDFATVPLPDGAVLTSVLGLVRERARQKSIDLACECPEDIGSIVADERRLKQALFNILSNAVKFTPENGEIVLSAHRDNGEIILTTRDSGIGISAEDQERVFGKFERGSNPEARRSGAGLGLSLVKSFVELHGGSVALESAADAGTKVICTLPARASGSALLPH